MKTIEADTVLDLETQVRASVGGVFGWQHLGTALRSFAAMRFRRQEDLRGGLRITDVLHKPLAEMQRQLTRPT